MKIKLLFALSVLYSSYQAQTTADLKGLINKNNVIIHSVQKQLMAESNPSYIITFKRLLIAQESAVKIFYSNPATSAYLALSVRKECLDFLKANSKKSLTYFELSESEKNIPSVNDNVSYLSDKEAGVIEKMDALNPQQLNNLTLTVQ